MLMRATLWAVGLIDLLDFVRRSHSPAPHLSLLQIRAAFQSPSGDSAHHSIHPRFMQVAYTIQATSSHKLASHHSHRLLAIQLAKAPTLDAGAGSEHSRWSSIQEKRCRPGDL